MRIASYVLTAIILLAPASALAQDWIEYEDLEQRFTVNLPGQPTIEDTTIISQRGSEYPARIYRVNDGVTDYMVKVVNYDGAIVSDVRGSVAWEAWHYRMDAQDAGGEITFDGYAQIDRIEGHQLQITNADQSKTYISIHLYNRRLYVLEATAPEGAPRPMLFQVSLSMLNEDGTEARFTIDADGQRISDD
jgi:hypothetical protein